MIHMSKLIGDIKKKHFIALFYIIFLIINYMSIVHYDTITDARKSQHTFLSIVIP